MVNRKKATKWLFASALCRRQTLLIFSVFFFVCVASVLYAGLDSYEDGIAYILWGYGLNYLNIIDFLRFLIMRLSPIYLISSVLSTSKGNDTFFKIRLDRYSEWQKTIERVSFCIILLFLMLQLLSVLVCLPAIGSDSLLTNKNFIGHQYADMTHLVVTMVAVILENLMSMLLFLNFYVRADNEVLSFLFIMFLYCMVILVPFQFYPFGISSIPRLFSVTATSAHSCIIAFEISAIISILHIALNHGTQKYLAKG